MVLIVIFLYPLSFFLFSLAMYIVSAVLAWWFPPVHWLFGVFLVLQCVTEQRACQQNTWRTVLLKLGFGGLLLAIIVLYGGKYYYDSFGIQPSQQLRPVVFGLIWAASVAMAVSIQARERHWSTVLFYVGFPVTAVFPAALLGLQCLLLKDGYVRAFGLLWCVFSLGMQYLPPSSYFPPPYHHMHAIVWTWLYFMLVHTGYMFIFQEPAVFFKLTDTNHFGP